MRVIIESPYAGDVTRNVAYLRRAMRDSLARGEAPFASHAMYALTGVLNDDDPAERLLGIAAGLTWARGAELTAVYQDYGISPGMELGIENAMTEGRRVTYRTIEPT
jgi:hypothetical protein